MPALGMSHVAFCVRDMEKSLAFYQEALGFRVLQDRRQDTTTGGLPHVYKHRRATRRQVTLAYGEGDARPQLVMTEHPGEPPDGEPIKLDQIGISHLSFRGCLETKPLYEKRLCHIQGKAKNGLTG